MTVTAATKARPGWLSVFAALSLLVTALGWTGPSAAGQADESIPSEFQVFTCPRDYDGSDYLNDCSPVGAGAFSITVTDTSPTEPSATTATNADGFVSFATFPGLTSFALEVLLGTTVYYTCFDGADAFLFDGAQNTIETTLAEGDALSCRWYITPSGGSGGPSPIAAPSGDSGSAVTIQVLTCPNYYDGTAFRDDCTPGLGDASDGYLIDVATDEVYDGRPDERGVTELTGIPARTYFLGVGVFRQYNEVYLSCFDVTSGGEEFLFDETITVATLYATPPNNLITIEAGRNYSCRYYVIPGGTSPDQSAPEAPVLSAEPSQSEDPADGSVGVQIFDCPEGYAEATYANDCKVTTRPVGVTLNDGYRYNQATVIRDQAGDEGRAGFVDLEGGQYYLAVDELSDTSTIYWSCFDLPDGNERFDRDGYHNRIRLYLDPSADYSCRIYLTPNGPETPAPGTAGTVTVNVLSCPESYRGPDWAAQCTDPVDGNRVAITGYPSRGPGSPNGMEIYEGTAIFQDVAPGTYAPKTDIPGHNSVQRSTCIIGAGPIDDALIADSSSINRSSGTGNGQFDLAAGEGATCVVYITWVSFRA
jgi:hypothetical protein